MKCFLDLIITLFTEVSHVMVKILIPFAKGLIALVGLTLT